MVKFIEHHDEYLIRLHTWTLITKAPVLYRKVGSHGIDEIQCKSHAYSWSEQLVLLFLIASFFPAQF